MTIQNRKTRFVCISDTHNATPADGAFKLPKGDVLIHAGDLTKQGTFAELRKTLAWINDAEFEVKLVVAGNHDITLDKDFYAEHGRHFHNQHPQDSDACINLIKEYPSVTFLKHEALDVRLQKPDGPKTTFRVFGSPMSPANGLWAFGYPREKASAVWDGSIPLDTDIVITHTPPKYHCDESKDRGAAGCENLRQKLWRVRPSLHVCGHVHEGRGAERVFWDLETPNVKYKEVATGYWSDGGLETKKQSLIDLSAKSSAPLNNTGDWGNTVAVARDSLTEPSKLKASPPWTMKVRSSIQHVDGSHPACQGQGGTPPSGRCDMEALHGRLERKETCIVNAAVMASSWPYTSKNSRRYNKPIIVDLDLPLQAVEEEISHPILSDRTSPSNDTSKSSQETYASAQS